MKEKKSKKKTVILIVVIVIVVAAIFFVATTVKKTKDALASFGGGLETAEVTTRTLTKSVGATGTVVSVDKKDLSVNLTGVEISKLNVEVGDSISSGDAVAEFDLSKVEDDLADVKKQYNSVVASNALSKESEQLSANDTERKLQDAVDTAYDNWQDAKETLEEARGDLNNANYYFDLYYDTNYAYYKAKVDAYTDAYEAAEKAVENCEKAYNDALKDQESTLATTANQKKTTSINQSTSTLSYESQIRSYEEQLEDSVLYSPISGIVTAVNFEEGDTYTGTALVTVQDTSAYEIETEIGEYDISDIELGQKVLIKTDATGEEQLTGKVVKISPTATKSVSATSASAVTYTVRVALDENNDRLRLDMTASLSIIIEQHENAMTVPYNAVKVDEDGNNYVSLIDENAAAATDVQTTENADGAATDEVSVEVGRRVPVTVVMESNYYTEIASDELKEGDIVEVTVEESMNVMEELMGGF